MQRAMSHRRASERGFTLAEIMVTTAIFAIIMIAALAVYDKSNKVFKSSTESADLQQSTRIGFDKLVADLRMAGFDYSRGGTPTGDGQYAQVDEQIEYAGQAAIVFRANFDYNTDAAHGNGLEDAEGYTPKNAKGQPIFPYITTGNDEIVAYVLRSADTTKNTESISFFADTTKPRSAYPNGKPEQLVTIGPSVCSACGVDTTNNNPPYTLYRMTVDDITNRLPGTPVAENIRALHLLYFIDSQGTNLLGDPPAAGETKQTPLDKGRNADGSSFDATYKVFAEDGTSTTYQTGAIGGAGQWDPSDPDGDTTPNFVDRSQRSLITSVRVELTGMSANPDSEYRHPTETIGLLRNYRQYQLNALIVPRNLGLTGFPEPSYTPPAPPSITGMCVAACAAPTICWAPPTAGGPVVQYMIQWDSNPGGSFGGSGHTLIVTDPNARSAILPDDGAMNPSLTWYYRIIAQNDNGSSIPSNLYSAIPKNYTTPESPDKTRITASIATVPHSSNAANIDYGVGLTWYAPNKNKTYSSSCTGVNCADDPSIIPAGELVKYEIWRGIASDFVPGVNGVRVLSINDASQPPIATPGSQVSWVDSATTSLAPPGACTPYYYRIRAIDRCANNPAWNSSGLATQAASAYSPDNSANEAAVQGQAYDAGSGIQAAAPANLKVDTTTSACPKAPSPTLCQIDLQWTKVTTDTANNPIGVDKYRITRWRKKILDPSYSLDTTFGGSGNATYTQKGYSQGATGTATFRDNTAPAADPADGQLYYYQYTVAANDCRPGQESSPVTFPTSCSINPAIVQAGAQNPGASGDSPNQAWVFNAGDTITVSPPAATTLTGVDFDIYQWPAMNFVGTVAGTATATPSVGSFAFTWTDQQDGQLYYIRILVKTATGCNEVHIKYVQDQTPASCSFANIAAPAPSVTPPPGGSAPYTVNSTLTITNNGPEPMRLKSQPISLKWGDLSGTNNFKNMQLVVVQYGEPQNTPTPYSSSQSMSVSLPNSAPFVTTTALTTPSDLPDLPVGKTLTLQFTWQYPKNVNATITVSPISKLCITYVAPSELPATSATKRCNLVGQAGVTANPTSCD